MALYELIFLGDLSSRPQEPIVSSIAQTIDGFGLAIGREVAVWEGADATQRNRRAAIAAVYFHGPNTATDEEEVIGQLLRDEVPIIPVLRSSESYTDLPDRLSGLNGMHFDGSLSSTETLAAALLECVGLLRRQRRVFISYRRTESKSAAIQLHDLLGERGFDVFLDTHDVRFADSFQDVLWHRLVDADVLVMLDTPGYFDSKWTRRELGHARACDVHIIRVVWPGHTPTRHLELSDTVVLQQGDLTQGSRLKSSPAKVIADRVESMRSRSMGARYLSLTGKFRAEAEKVGARFNGVGANRALSISLSQGERIWVYPVIGVPTAEVLNEISDNADRAQQEGRSVVLYEHVGIRPPYMRHLEWLELHPRTLKTIKVREADWALVELE